jgi:galactose mutarotase-like enzyme
MSQEICLSNEFLTVKISSCGAELQSLLCENIEYLWQADSKYWARKAPILFPIVGKLKNNQYRVDGKTYHLNQHGFARDSEFNIVQANQTECTLELKSTEQSLEKYPFQFSLCITYHLIEKRLVIEYKVTNLDRQKMYFQIGAHPGFNIPLRDRETYTDYQVVFSVSENVVAHQVNLNSSLVKKESAPFLENSSMLDLTQNLFDLDYFLIKDYQSKSVSLLHKSTQKGISLHRNNFPYLGIWSPKSCQKFVCLEPWFGHSDFEDFEGELSQKDGVIGLDVGAVFVCDYGVEVV